MNSELLHTHSRSEGLHNGKLNKKTYRGKETTECSYELHMNLCNNKPTFDSAILLLIDHKMHNKKLSRVPTLYSFIEGIFISS